MEEKVKPQRPDWFPADDPAMTAYAGRLTWGMMDLAHKWKKGQYDDAFLHRYLQGMLLGMYRFGFGDKANPSNSLDGTIRAQPLGDAEYAEAVESFLSSLRKG